MKNFIKFSILYFVVAIPVVSILGAISMMDGNNPEPEITLSDLTLITNYKEFAGAAPTNESTYNFLNEGGIRAKLVCKGEISGVSAFTQELSNEACHQQKQEKPLNNFYSETFGKEIATMTKEEYVGRLDAGQIGYACRTTEKSIDFCAPADLYIAKTNAWYGFKYWMNMFYLGSYLGVFLFALYLAVLIKHIVKSKAPA